MSTTKLVSQFYFLILIFSLGADKQLLIANGWSIHQVIRMKNALEKLLIICELALEDNIDYHHGPEGLDRRHLISSILQV